MVKKIITIKDKNTGVIIENMFDLDIQNLQDNELLYSDDDFEITYPNQAVRDYLIEDLEEYNNGKRINIKSSDDWKRYKELYSYVCQMLNESSHLDQKRKAGSEIFTIYGTNQNFQPLEIVHNNGNYFLKTEKLTGYDSSEYFYAKVNTIEDIFHYLNKINYGIFPSLNADNIFKQNEYKPDINDVNESSIFTGNYFLSYQNDENKNTLIEHGYQGLKSIYEEIEHSGAMSGISGNGFNINLGNYNLVLGYFKSQGFDRAGDHINGHMEIIKKELFDEIIENIPSSTLKI
mgnify:CR=1 FL=1